MTTKKEKSKVIAKAVPKKKVVHTREAQEKIERVPTTNRGKFHVIGRRVTAHGAKRQKDKKR